MKKSCLLVLFALFAAVFAQKSVDQVARGGSCSTSAVSGLSSQLIDQINCLSSGTFKSFEGVANIQYATNVFPYLQAPAADALINAVTAAKTTISINSALRSLPQQYLLYRWNQLGLCGITAAAAPGRSNHNGGLAIDINDHNSWISRLKPYHFVWFGSSDVVHFTYTGNGTQDVNTLAVKAFQTLWNRNVPNDQITVDGVYGPATESRLQRAPSTGFALGATCAAGNRKRSTTTCTANGVAGTCISVSDCTGTTTSGLCPGSADIKCCTNSVIQSASECTSDNGVGTCIDVADCDGDAYSGFCPGANNIKCCVASSPAPAPSPSPSPAPVPAPTPSGDQTVNQDGVLLIQSFEGFYANFYIDPVGIKTIGFGHACTVSDCSNLQGKDASGNFYKVTPPLTRAEATDLLRGDMDNLGFEKCVNKAVTRTITDDQFSALISFAFNLGCGSLTKSTLLKRVNANAPLEGTDGIRAAFVSWNKAGGKVLTGLTRRRNAEADLYGGKLTTNSRRRDPDTDGVGAECWHYGEKGVCLHTAYCTGFRVTGLCPGSADVQCCLRNKCTVNTTNDGMCALATSCAGQVSSNATCLGATDLQCCVGSIPEPTTQCPNGSSWSTTNRWCQTTDGMYALGPFTRHMIDQCYSNGGGDEVCEKKYPVTWSGESLYVLRWPMDFALRVRGTADCLSGSTPSNNYQGYCVETISVLAPGSNTSTVTELNVYGAMNSDLQDACQSYGGGLACVTPRWGGDFFRSIAQPFYLSIYGTNDTNTVGDDGTDSDTMSNYWLTSQNKLSSEHMGDPTANATVDGTSTGDASSDQPSDAGRVMCSIFLVVCSLFLL